MIFYLITYLYWHSENENYLFYGLFFPKGCFGELLKWIQIWFLHIKAEVDLLVEVFPRWAKKSARID